MSDERGGRGRGVLVTGGAGFIGGHIADALLAGGWRVLVADDLSSGDAANVPTAAELIACDIAAPELLPTLAAHSFNAVVHCAAQVSVPVSVTDPAHDRQVNLAGTENVIAAAKRAGAGRFVFISTGGAIYGDTTHAATEETPPAPLSPYGVHKLAAEWYVALSGIPYAILRLANVYGPRQRSHAGADGAVVPIFIERIAHGLPITIHGDGEQVRDFVYVADVAAAAVAALSHDASGIWNVSSGADTTINALAQSVARSVGVAPQIAYGPARAGDVRLSRIANERIVRAGWWRPTYTLPQGLAATLAVRGASPLSPPPE